MKNLNKLKRLKFFRRQRRTRAKIKGTGLKPRLSVFRSLRNISVQAIDDFQQETLAAASSKELKKKKGKGREIAKLVGELMGQKLKEKKIKEAVFDRGAYKYHGRVKALAEGLRKMKINF